MATISSWTHPFESYLDTHPSANVGCRFRALIHSEIGLEHCLRNLPASLASFVADLRALNGQGRAAQEHSGWETANDSFVKCKNMILTQGVETLGRLVYCNLVAWANLFLAQLNQLMGGVENLEMAMLLRKEILGLVQPLHGSGADPDTDPEADPQRARVCHIYHGTAQYELGDALGSSEQKKGAIQSFSQSMNCTEDAAAAQICFLLCSDHECSGKFDKSLRWIREANRIRKENLSEWNSCKFAFLVYEARLLMKLDKFSEALAALQETMQTSECNAKKMQDVHEMLLECYTRMSRRAADIQYVQRAEEYESSAREQHSLIESLIQ